MSLTFLMILKQNYQGCKNYKDNIKISSNCLFLVGQVLPASFVTIQLKFNKFKILTHGGNTLQREKKHKWIISSISKRHLLFHLRNKNYNFSICHFSPIWKNRVERLLSCCVFKQNILLRNCLIWNAKFVQTGVFVGKRWVGGLKNNFWEWRDTKLFF